MIESTEHDERDFTEWHRDLVAGWEAKATALIVRSKASGIGADKSRDYLRRARILGNCVATARKG